MEEEVGRGSTFGHDGFLCTYYVYDNAGNLRFVIPPEAVRQMDKVEELDKTFDPLFAEQWYFSYQYNNRGQVIEKKVPGVEPVSMVYDQRDRLVATQDGNQREKTAVVIY